MAKPPALSVQPLVMQTNWAWPSERSRAAGEFLSECLEAHGDVVGVYNMGAGNRGLIAALSGTRKKRVVVAHELNEQHRALFAGAVDAIIHQDAGT